MPAILAALLSDVSLVAANEKSPIEAADLHHRWTLLGNAYTALWSDMYASSAPAVLAELKQQEAAISKSSTTMPNDTKLMLQAERNVVMHRGLELAA